MALSVNQLLHYHKENYFAKKNPQYWGFFGDFMQIKPFNCKINNYFFMMRLVMVLFSAFIFSKYTPLLRFDIFIADTSEFNF